LPGCKKGDLHTRGSPSSDLKLSVNSLSPRESEEAAKKLNPILPRLHLPNLKTKRQNAGKQENTFYFFHISARFLIYSILHAYLIKNNQIL